MCYSRSTAQRSSADWCQMAEKGLDFDRLLSPELQNCVIKAEKKQNKKVITLEDLWIIMV